MTEQRAAAPATPYARIGGDAGVRALAERFYDLMDVDPAYAHVRATHGASLDSAREKLHLFLSGWLGGPPLYVEKHGHPRLRARHLPFPIGSSERDQWLLCMAQAMSDLDVPQPLFDRLLTAFHGKAFDNKNIADGVGIHAANDGIRFCNGLIKTHFPNRIDDIPGDKKANPCQEVESEFTLLLVKNRK